MMNNMLDDNAVGEDENMEIQVEVADLALDTPMELAADQTGQEMSGDNNAFLEDGIDESRPSGTLVWKVENVSRIRDTILSPSIIVRNLPWRMMVMQRSSSASNIHDRPARSLGFFLQCNGDTTDNSAWSCYGTAYLKIKSQKEGVEDFKRRIQHHFYAKENDWGFSHFMGWNEVLDPEKGYIVDDSVILEATIMADAPHGVSWDSKKHTGYVGLKNQGATCYMNSLLQTLYFTNYLRIAVYKMPTECDDSTKSVALALQRVFYDLQTLDKPVGTKKLTKSFGWEALDSFMQHDVQEFLRVLLDKLENKMKRTCVEGTIPKLFEGKMQSFIKCKFVDYESKRTETYYDIQLNIKGKKNIDESFKDYIAKENLDGDNKYDAADHGMQEAEKGVIFETFPPVLHLHLMRFQYDPVTDSSVKFNDRFEFYDHIDLTPYLLEPGPTPAMYTLHAVLVHSGDNHGGHYVVFLNPKGDGKWFKFDDDVVSKCTKEEAIDFNFGGQDEESNLSVRHCTNAYMLVYIRDSELPTILQDVHESVISKELESKLLEEKRVELFRRRERAEVANYMTLNVFLEENFEGHQGTELFDFDFCPRITFKLKKNMPMESVLTFLSDSFGYKMDQMRVWPFVVRSNQSFRPTHFDMNHELGKHVFDVVESNIWNVYLELQRVDADSSCLPIFNSKSDVLIFFKLYEPEADRIYYCGHLYVNSGAKLLDIIPLLNEKAGYPLETPLVIYEELKPFTVEQITDQTTPLEKIRDDLCDGDIFVFQRAGDGYPTCRDHFKELLNRVEIVFCDATVPNDSGFPLELSHKSSYSQLLDRVTQYVGVDKNRLQMFKCNATSVKDVPGVAIPHSYEGPIKDLLNYNMTKRGVRKMFYQKIGMPLHELENKRAFKVIWVGPKLKEEMEMTLYPNKNGMVGDLLEEAKKAVELAPDGSGKLRIFELQSCKLLPGPDEKSMLESLGSHRVFRIEEIPKDEIDLEEDEMLIPVAHFNKDVYATFGIPFMLKIKQKERFCDIRDRVMKKLGVSEKDYEKYKFSVVMLNRPRYNVEASEVNLNIFRNSSNAMGGHKPWIGLDHTNKTPKRTRFNYLEKSIKIYN